MLLLSVCFICYWFIGDGLLEFFISLLECVVLEFICYCF
ncbi:hypothetical protein C530_211 [Candidatus Portiera aleyrodidarum BT-B-HRs]|nr:hypothetical protein C548_210 [Candidatus Portiera aleyrodidarum BT-QVLC]AFT80854.1 hypothetical protein C530_211 [Candidatus Portiera aleyrodidarum BT-B-HRs]